MNLIDFLRGIYVYYNYEDYVFLGMDINGCSIVRDK